MRASLALTALAMEPCSRARSILIFFPELKRPLLRPAVAENVSCCCGMDTAGGMDTWMDGFRHERGVSEGSMAATLFQACCDCPTVCTRTRAACVLAPQVLRRLMTACRLLCADRQRGPPAAVLVPSVGRPGGWCSCGLLS